MNYTVLAIILILLGVIAYIFITKKNEQELVYESVISKQKSIKEKCDKAEWSNWDCDPVAGIEKRSRSSECYPSTEERPCTRNCKFSNWGKWLCLDNRQMKRTRTIERPAFRGGSCEGNLEEIQEDTQNMCVITESMENQKFEDGDFQSIVVEIVGAGGKGGDGSSSGGGKGGGSGEYKKIVLPYINFWDKSYSIVIGNNENSDTKFIVDQYTFVAKSANSVNPSTSSPSGDIYIVEKINGSNGNDGSILTGIGGNGADSQFAKGGISSYLSRDAKGPGAGGAGGCSTSNTTGACSRPTSTPSTSSTTRPTTSPSSTPRPTIISDSLGGNGGVGGVKISYIFRSYQTQTPTPTPTRSYQPQIPTPTPTRSTPTQTPTPTR